MNKKDADEKATEGPRSTTRDEQVQSPVMLKDEYEFIAARSAEVSLGTSRGEQVQVGEGGVQIAMAVNNAIQSNNAEDWTLTNTNRGPTLNDLFFTHQPSNVKVTVLVQWKSVQHIC